MTVLRHPNNNGVTLSQWRKTAAGGETSLSGTDDFSAGLSYTVGAEQVFVNGVLIERGVDYTASTGTTVTGLTALVAGDIVTVSSPSSFQVANAIPKNTITAKGDLIVATGASTPANLAVGADGTTLVANSSASTGVSWAGNQAAGKNAIINGGFDIWQRGTSFSTAAAYCADRWFGNWTGTATYSQETSTLPTGSKYAIRMTANSTASMYLTQNIETLNAVQFAGQNVSFSFQAQGSVSTGILMVVQYSTAVDNPTTGTWTVISATSGGSGTAPVGSFATISGVYAIPSTAKSILINFNTTSTTTGNYIIVGKAQFELGSIATPFVRNASTLQGELAACQRYYWRASGLAYNRYAAFGIGVSGTVAQVVVPNPVPMRVAPTSIDYASLGIYDTSNLIACVPTIDTAGVNATVILATVASGATQYRPFHLINNNNASGYIGFSAEL